MIFDNHIILEDNVNQTITVRFCILNLSLNKVY